MTLALAQSIQMCESEPTNTMKTLPMPWQWQWHAGIAGNAVQWHAS